MKINMLLILAESHTALDIGKISDIEYIILCVYNF